jgi:hypothetical protein
MLSPNWGVRQLVHGYCRYCAVPVKPAAVASGDESSPEIDRRRIQGMEVEVEARRRGLVLLLLAADQEPKVFRLLLVSVSVSVSAATGLILSGDFHAKSIVTSYISTFFWG